MLKRRSAWFGGSAALLLILSATGVVGATDLTPPDAQTVVVDTTGFVDVDGNGIDDTCQPVAAVADPVAAAAADAAVDTNADGVISTTEAAQSARIGGANCNHGGYVSWIAHQSDSCTTPVVTPTVVTPVVATVEDESVDENDQGAGDQTKDDESEATEPDAAACDADSAIDGAKKDKVAAAAARAASKAERTLAREAKKAERAADRLTAKADRAAARLAKATAHATKAHKAHKSH